MNNKNRFYVYALLDPRKHGKYSYGKYSFDYEPFYIGKGCKTRMWQHTSSAVLKQNRNPYLCNKIRKLHTLNLQPLKIKIKEYLGEKKALLLEKKIIKLIGLKKMGGTLTNIDEGGNPSPKMTKDLKLKISKSKIEYYKNHVHPWLGRKHSKTTKLKISKNHSSCWNGKKHTLKSRKRISMASTGRSIPKMCNVYLFISPEGKETTVKNGLKNFCKQHNLCLGNVRKLIRGTRNVTRGWCFKKKLKVNNTGKNITYKIISPYHKTFIVNNGLQRFCRLHKLQYVDMIKVAKKERNHHKKWKCEYC